MEEPLSGVFEAKGGLCNRLRTIYRYGMLAKKNNLKLTCLWVVNHVCGSPYNECFEPLENIRFEYIRKIKENLHYSFENNVYLKEWASFFRPLPNIKKAIDQMKNKIQHIHSIKKEENKHTPNYVAVHIRRTDHIVLAKSKNKYTEDDVFHNFISKTDCPVYLATDNADTQSNFIQKYGEERIFFWERIKHSEKLLRQTDIFHAIVDLYVCAGSNDFCGTQYSSFTDTILHLRGRKEFNLSRSL